MNPMNVKVENTGQVPQQPTGTGPGMVGVVTLLASYEIADHKNEMFCFTINQPEMRYCVWQLPK